MKEIREDGWLTAILLRGEMESQLLGGNSAPNISAVPERRRMRRGMSGPTSTLSSLSFANLNCLDEAIINR